MYTPSAFAIDDPERLFHLMEENSFAMLVTQSDDGPVVSHLPVLINRAQGEQGTIIGHLARANPQWRDAPQRALAVFSGPHAYISPAWYVEHNVLPTWNYVAVHAAGTIEWFDEPDELAATVTDYVAHYEADRDTPWKLDSNDARFNRDLLSAIVGFRIKIDSLKGKAKLNQNLSTDRQRRVADKLLTKPADNERQIGELMRKQLPRDVD